MTAIRGKDGRVTHVSGSGKDSSSSSARGHENDFSVPADLVLIAVGFSHPEHEGLIEQLGLETDGRGNVRAPVFAASVDGVFAAGDARIGQSLTVTAIDDGRKCARAVDRYLAAS